MWNEVLSRRARSRTAIKRFGVGRTMVTEELIGGMAGTGGVAHLLAPATAPTKKRTRTPAIDQRATMLDGELGPG
jgi:hypothetical protein